MKKTKQLVALFLLFSLVLSISGCNINQKAEIIDVMNNFFHATKSYQYQEANNYSVDFDWEKLMTPTEVESPLSMDEMQAIFSDFNVTIDESSLKVFGTTAEVAVTFDLVDFPALLEASLAEASRDKFGLSYEELEERLAEIVRINMIAQDIRKEKTLLVTLQRGEAWKIVVTPELMTALLANIDTREV